MKCSEKSFLNLYLTNQIQILSCKLTQVYDFRCEANIVYQYKTGVNRSLITYNIRETNRSFRKKLIKDLGITIKLVPSYFVFDVYPVKFKDIDLEWIKGFEEDRAIKTFLSATKKIKNNIIPNSIRRDFFWSVDCQKKDFNIEKYIDNKNFTQFKTKKL